MLTVQILTKNNEKTIEKCLDSIISLNPTILITDQGSNDQTIKICEKYKCTIHKNNNINNYSKLRNSLIKDGWNLWLHPYEFVVDNSKIKEITLIKLKKAFSCKIAQNTTIIKETRLWNDGSQFKNPVFETLNSTGLPIDCLIYSTGGKLDPNYLKIVEDWKNSEPLSADPYYYQAFIALQQKSYDNFCNLANHYFFKDKISISSVMLRFYMSTILAYELDDLERATKNLLQCIAIKPTMAEFWCLLGDIFYKGKDYSKAIPFYENAVILGSQRRDDDWPIDYAKYKEYPESMLASIDNIVRNLKTYRAI